MRERCEKLIMFLKLKTKASNLNLANKFCYAIEKRSLNQQKKIIVTY